MKGCFKYIIHLPGSGGNSAELLDGVGDLEHLHVDER